MDALSLHAAPDNLQQPAGLAGLPTISELTRPSAFLITTIPNCKDVTEYVRDMGLQDRFKVIIGGAETSQEKAENIGADGWAPNAVEAVTLCKKLMEAKQAG